MDCTVKTGIETNYDLCISCPHLGTKCNGPNLSVISTARWCEWSRLLKEKLHWSNAHIAELSGISLPTVNRVMSGNISGLTVETKYRISYAMIFQRAPGEDPAKFPCAMVALGLPSETDLAALAAENSTFQTRLQEFQADARSKIDFLKEQIAFKEEQMRTKDKQLEDRAWFIRKKDKSIVLLASLLGLAVLIIAAFLIVDFLDLSRGFFWLETMSAFLS